MIRLPGFVAESALVARVVPARANLSQGRCPAGLTEIGSEAGDDGNLIITCAPATVDGGSDSGSGGSGSDTPCLDEVQACRDGCDDLQPYEARRHCTDQCLDAYSDCLWRERTYR